MKRSFLALFVMIAVLAYSNITLSAQTIITQTISKTQTTLIQDAELVQVIGGDWVDAACAVMGGVSVGAAGAEVAAAAGVRLVARVHIGFAIAVLIADIYCLLR